MVRPSIGSACLNQARMPSSLVPRAASAPDSGRLMPILMDLSVTPSSGPQSDGQFGRSSVVPVAISAGFDRSILPLSSLLLPPLPAVVLLPPLLVESLLLS